MSGRVFLGALIDGKQLTADDLQDLIDQEIISNRLKASNEQLSKDLEGFFTDTQKNLLREMLSHIDELHKHANSIDKQIENMMTERQKKAVEAILDIPGIANDSAWYIISVKCIDIRS